MAHWLVGEGDALVASIYRSGIYHTGQQMIFDPIGIGAWPIAHSPQPSCHLPDQIQTADRRCRPVYFQPTRLRWPARRGPKMR
jgi:hypothetical protein